jgi:hypothetical protein
MVIQFQFAVVVGSHLGKGNGRHTGEMVFVVFWFWGKAFGIGTFHFRRTTTEAVRFLVGFYLPLRLAMSLSGSREIRIQWREEKPVLPSTDLKYQTLV